MKFFDNAKLLLSNKKNIILAVLILVLFILVIVSIVIMATERKHKVSEGFDSESKPSEDKNKPYVDAKTGTMMDGPGFEKGEVEGATQELISSVPSNYYFIDDGANGEMSIQHNMCSKSCCSAQWPTPFKQKHDPYVCSDKADTKFVPSNIFCNNSFQDAGCLCLTEKQSQFLANRGGNGREWF